ncbi:MAG: ACT domain-containing protein [Thaumarchaeota archaeon]|nr:ACT domain-containing protein [Nitrososphaerota archaeon]
MQEIIILALDRRGLLADITEVVAKAGINLEYISAHVIADKAAVHLVTDKYKKTKRALSKAGFNVLSADTLVIKIDDKIGELSKVARKLSENDVNIMHIQFLAKKATKALLSLKVDRPFKAAKLLKKYL